MEGTAAAHSSKASRNTSELSGLAFAAAGKHWRHLPDEAAEAERSKSTERKAALTDATLQDAAPKEVAPGARVSVETRPAQEPKSGRVTTHERGVQEQIASLFVRAPGRHGGRYGGSAQKKAGITLTKPKRSTSNNGARAAVETAPAQENTGEHVLSRKRGRGAGSQERWADGVEGTAAAHSSKASRNTRELMWGDGVEGAADAEWQDNADQPNAATEEGPEPAPKDATPHDAEPTRAAPKDAAAGGQQEHRVQQLEQRKCELERQVLEEKHKQQITQLEARVAAIQAQNHALAFKLQAQESEKRAVIEQTLQQVRERTRHKELQLARINQGASGKENTAPPGQAEIPDIWLVCATPACSRTWKWTPGSQAFYKSVGKGTPKYCLGCRN